MNIAPSRRRNIFNFWQEIFLTRWCTWLSWGSCLWRETEVSSSQVSTNCSSKPQNWVFTTTIITSLGFSLLRHQPSMLASLSYLIKEKLKTTRLGRNYFHFISFYRSNRLCFPSGEQNISMFDDDLIRLLERRPDESGEMVELINNQCSPRWAQLTWVVISYSNKDTWTSSVLSSRVSVSRNVREGGREGGREGDTSRLEGAGAASLHHIFLPGQSLIDRTDGGRHCGGWGHF